MKQNKKADGTFVESPKLLLQLSSGFEALLAIGELELGSEIMCNNYVQQPTMMMQHAVSIQPPPANAPTSTTTNTTSSNNYLQQDIWANEISSGESALLMLVQAYDWAGVLSRVATHPSEARLLGVEERTPLHLACEKDAPAVVIQSLLKSYPEASVIVGTSGMTPLHITCSSSHASVHVIRVLLDLGLPEQLKIRDADGDTPLHAACRCGAPMDVLEVLVAANLDSVDIRDYEGLTPLLRLWVRCFVMIGSEAMEGVSGAADLTGELGEAWKKTELLLKCSHYGTPHREAGSLGGIIHAASAVDCPREVLKIAARLYPDELVERDEDGKTPLIIAAQSPVFKERDLTDGGYALLDYGDEMGGESFHNNQMEDTASPDSSSGGTQQPSVIEVLLQAAQEAGRFVANVPDKRGNYPLHIALVSGKKWQNGVETLLHAYPEALSVPHSSSGLLPFMVSAEGNRDDLNNVYELLRHSPSSMSELLAKRRKKNH